MKSLDYTLVDEIKNWTSLVWTIDIIIRSQKKYQNSGVSTKEIIVNMYRFKVSNRNTRKKWNIFKVNNKDTRAMSNDVVLLSLLLTLNLYHTFF